MGKKRQKFVDWAKEQAETKEPQKPESAKDAFARRKPKKPLITSYRR